MMNKDDISRIVTGNLKGNPKKEIFSQLSQEDEVRKEFRRVKNTWALLASTKNMPESQVKSLFLDFKRQAKKQKSLRISFLKYAAILILALSVGTAGFLHFYQNRQPYVYSGITGSEDNGKSLLYLSDGTVVDIEKDRSEIALSSDRRITIDNERVIDLNKDDLAGKSKMNEVVVPFGKKTQLTLEDGTRVWLNAGSRMAFPTKFTGKKREVFMEGEGYFEVAHNKKLPFYVITGDIAIKVLGTCFNVSAYESDNLIETVLLEGSVSISKQSGAAIFKDELLLKPNQKASYNKDDRSVVIGKEPNADYVISWTEGVFKFYRQSIHAVLNKLQRHYNVQFILNPEFPAEDMITGKLYLEDSIDDVMKALEVVAKIQYRIDGNKIYVDKRLSQIPMKK